VGFILISLSVIICRRKLKRKFDYTSKRDYSLPFYLIDLIKFEIYSEKCLPNVSDDLGSSQSGNSPNLSVSEWIQNGIIQDDQNSDKSSSSQKHLLSNDSSLNTVIIKKVRIRIIGIIKIL
jgi:hypothetical protein